MDETQANTNARHGNETRRGEILAAAEKVFDAKGYAATTIDAVAGMAGISKGSVYNYFRSKQELFTHLFQEIMAVDEADVQHVLTQAGSAKEKLSRVVDIAFGRLGQYKKTGRLIMEFWATAARDDGEGSLSRTFQAMYAKWRQMICEILRQGIAQGDFSSRLDPQIGATLVIAVFDGIINQAILDVGFEVDDHLKAALKRSLLAGAIVGPEQENT